MQREYVPCACSMLRRRTVGELLVEAARLECTSASAAWALASSRADSAVFARLSAVLRRPP